MVNNKNKFYELDKKLAFGNRLRLWHSLEDYFQDEYHGKVNLRFKNVPGGKFIENASLQQIFTFMEKNQAVICEAAPDDSLILQGEVSQSINLYGLLYSREKVNMREAMKRASYTQGIRAKTILESHLNESSYADLEAILEKYPDHIVEFSTFNHNLGVIPGRNTIIWEVRAY